MEIHYFAAARSAAGTPSEQVDGEFATLADVLAAAASLHDDRLADVFDRCTFLIDGKRAEPGDPVAGARRVDVLPPFAGG